MWTFDELKDLDATRGMIGGKWYAARPLNYTKSYLSLWSRLKRAWKVFTCEADAFTLPCGQ